MKNKKYTFSFNTENYDIVNILCNNSNIDINILPYIHNTNINSLFIFNSSFEYIYKKFIKDIIKPFITLKRLYYNKIPNIFFNIPNKIINTVYSNNFIDNGQLTIILPITKMYDTNTIWIGQENPEPLDMDYGQFAILDQSNKYIEYPINKTNTTSIYISFNVSKKINTTLKNNLGLI
jgi:hypothetical protein